ncbi:MAG: polysaccharide pyruvyl transferase family protein [Hydrogenophaga sp.]|nr:polysaccharide pyruvyl transferase family protein [Hydrogenophaga sp.]
MKKYFIISGLDLHDNNRGTAALGYGAFSFLKDRFNTKDLTALNIFLYKKPWKFNFSSSKIDFLKTSSDVFRFETIYIWYYDFLIYKHLPFFSKFTKTAKVVKKVDLVAAINGGDGFSDIYGTQTFKSRLFDINLAIKENIPLVILPQTLGPFKDAANLIIAERILKYASKVYVRDLKFESHLSKIGVKFEITKDLSFYMKPEECDIEILPNSIGINISGLCYSNRFRDLSGRFDFYPQLIDEIINYFQMKNVPIYLIAHSYNHDEPEAANDDLQASRSVFDKLKNKHNVFLIDRDLTPPQIKYVISRLCFFVGTRMHANFAAIFTNTPVFGLAYSYKYEGAFDYMGLRGHYASVLDIGHNDIDIIISAIDKNYQKSILVLPNTGVGGAVNPPVSVRNSSDPLSP